MSEQQTVELDDDGYPTDETLSAIENWPLTDIGGALEFIKAAWHWEHFTSEDISAHEAAVLHADKGERFLRLATGGWSGNEDLLEALETNRVLWMMTWRLSTCGGLHIFQYPETPGGER